MKKYEIFSINGPVVKIQGKTDLKMLEMVYVGNIKLAGEVISIEICHTYGGNGVLVMCGIGNGEIAGRIGRRIEDKSDCAVGLSNPALLVNGKLRAELCENKLAGYVNAFVIRLRTRF